MASDQTGSIARQCAARHLLTSIAISVALQFGPARCAPAASVPPPAGSISIRLENVDGIVLIPATLTDSSGRDTSGLLVVDTGAGYLALDWGLASRFALGRAHAKPGSVELAAGFIPRLRIGAMQLDHVEPVMLIDADVIRRVTGRAVLGLAGQAVFSERAVWIDFEGGNVVCVPSPADDSDHDAQPQSTDAAGDSLEESGPFRAARAQRSRQLLAPLLSPRARGIAFRLAGDHKILVRARFRDNAVRGPGPWLTLVFDTGATKSVLFEPALSERQPGARLWPALTGLVAPTLAENASARLTLAPVFELETIDVGHPIWRERVDCAVITSDLAQDLSVAVGETVTGLLGYSFFKRYRVGIDYTNRTLWLDPYPRAHEDHPYEYSHVGLQLERAGDYVRVLGVASRSPADSAGVAVGDTLVSIGARVARGENLVQLTDLLEGPAGTRITLTLRRGGRPKTYRLVRRRLL